MAEEKKPKIDLKARLGKKTVTTSGGPAVPPPVGIPKPAVPGLGPVMSHSRPPPPKVDASDPYASITADSIPSKPKAEELVVDNTAVVEAQKRGLVKTIALVLVAAAVAGLIGFTFGDRYQANKGALAAVEGAGQLVVDVEAANAEVLELRDVLKATMSTLKDNKYPEDEVKKLGDINIPFDGSKLVGRGIGRFQAKTVTLLVQFASATQEANDAKEKLQLFLQNRRRAVTEVLSQQDPKTRKVEWGTFVINSPSGPMAVMSLLDKQSFPVTPKEEKKDEEKKDDEKKDDEKKDEEKKAGWPDAFKIKDGAREVELKRYTGGKCVGGDPVMIPVDPTSQGEVCRANPLSDMGIEVMRLSKVLVGDQTPGSEKQGLIQLGDLLVEELKKIGAP